MLKDKYSFVPVSSSCLHGFSAMNHFAAKAFGYKGIPRFQIDYANSLRGSAKEEAFKHDVAEAELMSKGWNYWDAHRKANLWQGLSWNDLEEELGEI